ncbi:hypothetical protein HC891_25760 [Candidatus Gracilibacteria bacterium]|nr:hypothetical protein [Candidatus Gracilibacteria bacterium]
MIPSAFEYFAPTSVEEAIGLLEQHGDDAKIIAGGHSLLPAMKLRLAAPAVIIDINKIGELRGVVVNGSVNIGAMTTYHTILAHDGLKAACAILPRGRRNSRPRGAAIGRRKPASTGRGTRTTARAAGSAGPNAPALPW